MRVVLITILVASLALNVFAVGFFSGRLINHDGPPMKHEMTGRGSSMNPSFRLMHFSDSLPSERRDEFRKAFREKLPAMRGDFQEMKQLRQEVSRLLGEETWDRSAIQAQFDQLQSLQQRQQQAFSTAFLDAFETLTPEERQMLREAAEKRNTGRHKRRGGKWRKHGGDRRGHQSDMPPPPPEEE